MTISMMKTSVGLPEFTTRNNVSTAGGFTLIELVITMVVMGIIATAMAPIINQFVDAYDAQLRRGALVERAQVTLSRMTREIHTALPNSLRTSGGTVVEMIRTIDGGRYRVADDPNTPDIVTEVEEFLEVDDPDDNGIFDVIGKLQDCANINTLAGGNNILFTMNNIGTPGHPGNAYVGLNIAQITACTPGGGFDGSDQITFINPDPGGTNKFVSYPVMNSFQIIDTPVSFLCLPDAANPANGKIVRYHGYNLSNVQPVTDGALNGQRTVRYTHDVLTNNIVACAFNYNTLYGLFTASITIQDETTNEVVRLMQQIHVENHK